MNNQNNTPLALIILDGLGSNPNPEANAVVSATTPTLDRLFKECSSTELVTHGEGVGLPKCQMGNSEVGHLNIGGGRIVKQELTRINEAIQNKRLATNEVLKAACKQVSDSPSSALHICGLVSFGGVHSSMEHLVALVEVAVELGVRQIFIHAITDGRDRPPNAAAEELRELAKQLEEIRNSEPKARIDLVTVIGRYYAMDRDNRWERTQKAYDLLTQGKAEEVDDLFAAVKEASESGDGDEFLQPMRRAIEGLNRSPYISDGDVLLLFNFRADRMRQLSQAFFSSKDEFSEFEREKRVHLACFATLTEYQSDFPVEVIFAPTKVSNHFGEVISRHGLKQLRVAETEKYPHVTYFFNGGLETPCEGEERALIPSPRDVPTYDHKPEMSAFEITDKVVEELGRGVYDVYVINFANCDMVGHTGNFDAVVKAVEAVDSCLGRVLEAIDKAGGSAIVTADHGNADQMKDYETGGKHTFHTMHPVPLFVVGGSFAGKALRSGGALCDIAPTALAMLGIEPPAEMSGCSLFEESK